jgi:isopenicillin N synthase-like dioxygenase
MYIGEVLKLGKSAERSKQSSSSSFSSSSSSSSVEVEMEEKFPDLKEMFSLGPSNPLAGFPQRQFPDQPVEFEQAWTDYYEAMTELGKTILSSFALTLQLPDERYFDQYLDHHASAIR